MKWSLICSLGRYFYFTDRDTRGLLIWIVVIMSAVTIKIAIPSTRFMKEIEGASIASPQSLLPSAVYSKYNSANSYRNYYQKDGSGGQIRKDSNNNRFGRVAYISPYKKKTFEVELNAGDTLDFQQLRGIGSAYAKRIVAYRDRLGGFANKEQLREVWGIDSGLYAQISPFVRLSKAVFRPININEIDIQTLKQHPYLDYYQAKEIIRYREKYGLFGSVEELKRVNLMDDETYQRIKPYLIVKKQ